MGYSSPKRCSPFFIPLLDFIIKGDYESYALAVNYMVKSYQKLAIIPVQDKQVVTNNSKL